MLALLPLLCAVASAQTSISGTVYIPNGTNVLPNVLVYVTTGVPAALVSGAVCPGVNCLTSANAVPAGVTNYTYTAVDGTFTLNNVPENASYTLVIQAGLGGGSSQRRSPTARSRGSLSTCPPPICRAIFR